MSPPAGEQGAVYESRFHQFGVCRDESIKKLFDVARSCVIGPLPENGRMTQKECPKSVQKNNLHVRIERSRRISLRTLRIDVRRVSLM